MGYASLNSKCPTLGWTNTNLTLSPFLNIVLLRMTICLECYGVGEAEITCGFCSSYVCEECYMRHLVACGLADEKQKLGGTRKAS